MALRAQFQLFILDLALHISFTIGFNFVQVLAQDLLQQILLKVRTSFEDVRCYVQGIYIKKEKIKLI